METEDWYKVRLSDIVDVYNNHLDSGANAIRLIYKKGKLRIEILCLDDSEPYWNYGGEYECTLKNWAILLYRIGNMKLVKDNGEPYNVSCEWDWFDEEKRD